MYAGFDIGGTKSAVVLSDGKKILSKMKFPTAGPEDTLDRLIGYVKKNASDIKSVGISCGGPLDEEKGLILSPPNLIGWDRVPVTEIVQKALGVPAFICNDANACALAEWKFGAGRGCRNMIFMTFGTGLGAGLILDGRLYRGSNGNAGEIGHVRTEDFGPVGYGKAGSYEGFCSGSGIKQIGQMRAKEALQAGAPLSFCRSEAELDSVNPKTIQDAAENGDAAAAEIYAVSAEKLGRCLALLVDLFNPEVIVIGSVYARAEELMRDRALEVMKKEALAASAAIVRVVPAALGESIGDWAGISVAMMNE